MQMRLKKFDEDLEISSYDEIIISLSRLEAIRIAAEMNFCDEKGMTEEAMNFRDKLTELIRPPDLSTE